jgi:hypothetical protein
MNDQADSDFQEDEGLDELESLQTKIADQLAELSAADRLPQGYKSSGNLFLPEEVDFFSSNWLLRTIEVQAWLCLNAQIDVQAVEANAVNCARNLFDQLQSRSNSPPFEHVDGGVRLTLSGAQQLSNRLDIATSLQSKFVEDCEQYTRKEATQNWKTSWDEEELTSAPLSAEPIKAVARTWAINQFTYYADRGDLNLNPSYQRGDVWPTSDAQRLIESIVRGIPLPSIIILKPNKSKKIEVVDGKQRLTSILRFIGRHPEALRRVKELEAANPGSNLLKLFNNDYRKFRKAWKSLTGDKLSDKDETKYYFPFPLRGSSDALKGKLEPLAGKYYCEIHNQTVDVGDSEEEVQLLFDLGSQYMIPIIEYSEATPKQIQDVFNLYNKQGKHLNAEEIRNAVYHEVDLVRLLLVASGDNKNVAELAKYLSPNAREKLPYITRSLDGYKFGVTRYKRTKVLSWLSALLFSPSIAGGALSVKSTAKHIDSLFTSIRDTRDHPLADRARLDLYVMDLHRTIDGHSSMDWPQKFRDKDAGSKWLELHLVASLTGSFLASLIEADVSDLLERNSVELQTFTSNVRRPENAQNNTQWGFIAEVALGMLEVLGIDEKMIEQKMLERYQLSCLATLKAARLHHAK